MKKWTAFIIGIIFVAIFVITMFVLPPLLGLAVPSFLSLQEFLDYIEASEGLIRVIIFQGIPIICVTIGAIFLLIFVVKLIRGKE